LKKKQLIYTLITLTLVVLFPILVVFLRNTAYVTLKEVLSTFLVFLGHAVFLLLIYRVLLRDWSKAALLVILTSLAFILFEPVTSKISTLIPMLNYWHHVYLLLTFLVLVSIWIRKKWDAETSAKILKIIGAIFAILVIINLSLSAPVFSQAFRSMKPISREESTIEQFSGNKVNVYLFIFDEYAGQDGLLRFTGHDNTPFYEKLQDIGFNVAPQSYNQTFVTNIEIPNLLNLSQIVAKGTESKERKNQALQSPFLFSLFKKNGYSVTVIDDQKFIPTQADYVDKFVLSQKRYEEFQLTMLKNSIYYPFFIQKEQSRPQEIKELLEIMKNSGKPSGHQALTVGYFLFPHMPWVLDENGYPTNYTEWENWKNSDAYLGQLKFVSGKIIEAVEKIIEKDPECIMVLLSDHGYRQPGFLKWKFNQTIENQEVEFEYMKNILNAVYFGGKHLDIEGLSGVNTLIKTLNEQFQLSLPIVEAGE
jgi:hypothetical protein